MKTRIERSAGGIAFRLRDEGGFDVALILTHEGRWQLPKGWIEDGEPAEAAALRETREEAGIDAEVVADLGTIDFWFRSTYDPEPARVHKYVQFFLLRWTGGDIADHDDEVQDARWVDIEAAEQKLAWPDERRMMALAREALAAAAAADGGATP